MTLCCPLAVYKILRRPRRRGGCVVHGRILPHPDDELFAEPPPWHEMIDDELTSYTASFGRRRETRRESSRACRLRGKASRGLSKAGRLLGKGDGAISKEGRPVCAESSEQGESMLFTKLPAEVRLKIYGYALGCPDRVLHVDYSYAKLGHMRCRFPGEGQAWKHHCWCGKCFFDRSSLHCSRHRWQQKETLLSMPLTCRRM
ncbi:MAG: hypothetical protein INR71_07850 [Terriglobus roseus]|nr:hypothetical protein [Terriglobus roseus]